jgi:UDP:flavonoid glycosyltransferase YjiC (YdhE family)
MNADRLVELGVARRDLVDDEEVARSSARLRADARAEGGTQHAADLIEDMPGAQSITE